MIMTAMVAAAMVTAIMATVKMAVFFMARAGKTMSAYPASRCRYTAFQTQVLRGQAALGEMR
jgi:hypothetical protein